MQGHKYMYKIKILKFHLQTFLCQVHPFRVSSLEHIVAVHHDLRKLRSKTRKMVLAKYRDMKAQVNIKKKKTYTLNKVLVYIIQVHYKYFHTLPVK